MPRRHAPLTPVAQTTSQGQTPASSQDERHVLRARDGHPLHVRELSPTRARVVGPRVVLGHAMMVDGRTLFRPGRPSLVATLLAAGLHCFVSEARGRDGTGNQPSTLDYGYDDHVHDVGSVLEFARSRGEGPMVLLGHSLFGHTSLAHLARFPEVMSRTSAPVVAHASLCSAIWLPSLEPSVRGRARKAALMRGVDGLVALGGRMPARKLGVGSCDESARYWADLHGFWRKDGFASAAGFDYRGAFGRITIPTLQVVSDGDTWMTRPADAVRFGEPLPQREVWHLGETQRRVSLRGVAPSHMGMLTDPASEPVWRELADWILRLA